MISDDKLRESWAGTFLSIRDQFALAALPTMLAASMTYNKTDTEQGSHTDVAMHAEQAAAMAYAVADAMLRERSIPTPPSPPA